MEYPQRLIRQGHEPGLGHVNNNCRMPYLARIKESLPIEYAKVMNEPPFAQVLAIYENGLHFSGRTVHTMLCRQLVTKKKHELWFVFGRKPLRFSLQEFHAVTGLKVNDDDSYDLDKYTDDNGFWAKLLRRKEQFSIKKMLDVYLVAAPGWENDDDKVRLVYLCVIAGLVMAIGEMKKIPLTYVQLVMDLEKVKTYPWGLVAFDHLVDSIVKRRNGLKNSSYILDGFTYALQVWAMEAIPLLGELCGEKINNEITAARCSNWKGSAKLSWDQISGIEETFSEKVS